MIKGESKRWKTLGIAGMCMLFALDSCCLLSAEEPNPAATVSQFLEEVTKEEYQEAAPPPAAPKLRWDFSQAEVVHTYTFKHERRGASAMEWPSEPGTTSTMSEESSVKGTLLVKSQGSGTAEMVLKDVVVSTKMFMREPEPETWEQEQQRPPIAVQGVNEDGSGPFWTNSMALFLRMPLPSRQIEIGESIDEPAELRFNAMSSVFRVTGHSRITLSRFVRIDDRTCAQLDVDTDISQLEVPEELEGEYRLSARGKSVFYFDITKRIFVSGTSALLMELSIDAPRSHLGTPDEAAPAMPERSSRTKTIDTLVRVTLEE
jgi:hypothetical protein